MNECQICHCPVREDVFRCVTCDRAWQAGYDAGRKYEKKKIKNYLKYVLEE